MLVSSVGARHDCVCLDDLPSNGVSELRKQQVGKSQLGSVREDPMDAKEERESPSALSRVPAAGRIRGYVYGTLVVLVALGSLGAESKSLQAPVAALVVFVGGIAIWLAYGFSERLGERIREGRRLGITGTAAVLRSSWPIVTAALPSAAFICLGWAGLWSVPTSLRGSTVLAVVALGIAGLLAARVAGEQSFGTVLDVAAAASLGVVIALLELAVTHA
jgi:hypothetical protein